MSVTLYHEHLQLDDRIVLYTDGITAACNPRDQEFSLDGFLESSCATTSTA
ncbi:hypothetical protein ACF08N_37695 [Streptomyces sp. NPDC015127]|uniref:hypothetical protein n=1 Tax=Streptomyces sp. NPDC015127 TaxID=3364939 RepID=UPI0036FA588E